MDAGRPCQPRVAERPSPTPMVGNEPPTAGRRDEAIAEFRLGAPYDADRGVQTAGAELCATTSAGLDEAIAQFEDFPAPRSRFSASEALRARTLGWGARSCCSADGPRRSSTQLRSSSARGKAHVEATGLIGDAPFGQREARGGHPDATARIWRRAPGDAAASINLARALFNDGDLTARPRSRPARSSG